MRGAAPTGALARGAGLGVAVVGLVLPAAPVAAQVGTATVLVRIEGPQGGRPETTVRLTGQGGATRTETTDRGGWAAFPNVAAGLVQVAPDLPPRDLAACPPREWVVAPDEVLVLKVRPPPPGAGCERAEEGARFSLTHRGRLFQGDEHELPSSATPWGLLETAEPAAVLDRMDGPGLYLENAGRFSMHGSSWTQNHVVLDGADITDPRRGGTPLAYPTREGLETADVTSGLMTVEYGTPGATLSLLARAPLARWGATAEAYWLPGELQAEDPPGSVPSIARFGSMQDGSVVASGPLGRPSLRLLLAARASRGLRFERADPAELRARVASLLAHAVHQRGERDAWHLLASVQSLAGPFPGRVRFAGAPVEEHQRFVGLQPRFEHSGDHSLWSVHAGYQAGTVEAQTEGRAPDRPVERLLDGPVPEVTFPGRSQRSTWQLGGRLALGAQRLRDLWHAPRLGLTFSRSALRENPGPRGLTPETVDGLPARAWDYDYAGPESRRHLSALAVYGAERLHWRDRLGAEAGLRFERTSGAADGAPQGVEWRTLSPRVSLRLRLTDRGGIALTAGYGQYTHRLLLQDVAFGDPAAPQGSVYRWSDPNGNMRVDPGEQGVLVARAGPGGAWSSIDPGLKPPRTTEWVLALEGRLGGEVAWRLTGFDRRERDLLESVDVGVPASAYAVSYVPDPAGDLLGPQDDQWLPVYARLPASFGQDRYLLTNPPGHAGHHQGLELRVETSLGRRLRLLAGGTAYLTEAAGANRGFRVEENDQGVIGELFDDPNADTHASGRTFFDRSYTLKLAATGRIGKDTSLGVVARYLDGQPFARWVIVPDLPQGPEAIAATPRGQIDCRGATDAAGKCTLPSGHRFTFTLTVDARLEQGVRVGGHRLALVAEAFNLLNTRHEVEEYAVSGPRFREATALQPPRVFRLGLRFQ